MQQYVQVLWRPAEALARAARERAALVGFAVVALSAVLGLIGQGIGLLNGTTRQMFDPRSNPGIPPEVADALESVVGVFGLGFALVGPFLWWVVVAALMQLMTRFLGGRGPFAAMLAVVGLAFLPLAIYQLVAIPIAVVQGVLGAPESGAGVAGVAGIGLLTFVLSLGALAWHVALVVIGGRWAREVTYGQSGGACALSCAGCLGLGIGGTLLLVIVGLLAGGAAP